MNISEFSNSATYDWYCDFLGYDIEVSIELEGCEERQNFSAILQNVSDWNKSFFRELEKYLFAYYDETIAMCGESEPVISIPSNVWKFVKIGSISIFSKNGHQFAQGSGWCEWEEEHGLEFDVNKTNQIVYVGSFISNGFYEDPDNPSSYNFIGENV